MPQAKKLADPNQPAEVGKPLLLPAQVSRVRFTSDGKLLAAACFDGTIRRWGVTGADPTEKPPLTGHDGWVTGLAVGPGTIFSSDSWGRLAAWGDSPKPVWTIAAAHDGWARAVAVSPDGAAVASCGRDGFVRLWDAKTGTKTGEIPTPADVLTVAFAPDGKTVLAGDLFGVVREFVLPGGKPGRTFEARELHKLDRIQDVGGVRCLAFSADGGTLFVAGAEPKTGAFVQCVPVVIAFDRATGKPLSVWKGASDNEGYVTDLLWHPAGHLIGTTSGQPGQGKVFFLKPGAAQPFAAVAKPNCHSVALHADRLAVAMTNANSSGNGRVKGKDGDYPGNVSPVQLFRVPKAPV